ncbi:MAG: RIP metalloprotease RseP [Alphaproteobacteria bacterium]|nr:RIP metalloprotease RseP [Alphaproteobacteria bacterium]MCB9984872.1 RIP metalloprotease RseP [Micavibrio sp.]HRK97264.1 RIP metalloprotease RseP [Alphaproteobacteria bacterium]
MDSLFELVHLVLGNVWTYGVTFLAVLGILVFVHEWGHYIVARLCGVRVEVFSVGFGREIFGWTAKSGTRWKISLFPLGGYVKMFGDMDPASAGHTEEIEDGSGHKREMTEEERAVAFFSKPVWKRALIVFAGPAINFIFAILILASLYMGIGRPVTPPQVTGVEVGSAADAAGFVPHDVVTAIDGVPIISFDEVRRFVMLRLDQEMIFEVERDGQILKLPVIPQKVTDTDRFGFAHERGYLGVIGPANGIDMSHISSVNGQETKGDLALTHRLVEENLGKIMTIGTAIDTRESNITIRPPVEMNVQVTNPEDKNYNALFLGVRPGEEIVSYGPFAAMKVAVSETWTITTETLNAVGQMVTGTRSAKELGGIIRIGAMAGDMAERGIISVVLFTALLSINLGLINLFPIPMLDGGHLLFYGVEAVRGKPIPERVQEYAFRFGLVILVSLMVFSNLNDVIQMFVLKGAGS